MIPQREYDAKYLKPGIAWQVEQLETLAWIREEQNIVIIGRCDTGKTTLATHIGRIVIGGKEGVYYCNIEEFLRVIKNHDRSAKTARIYRYITECSVIIIDDVMYANKLLREGAEQIREIEGKLTILEQKYPGCGKKPSDGDMSVPAENGKPIEKGDLMKFPAFEGKDLDGNEVKSNTLFAGNTVTVVNFWFTTCSPCVGELADLEALNKKLAEKGGAVVGINSFTLDGDKAAISDAKDILAKKGVTYKNIWFDSKGEAGKFTSGLYTFPTTYVVDKNGNIVGEPIVGAITGKKQAETLQKLIDQAIANSKG